MTELQQAAESRLEVVERLPPEKHYLTPSSRVALRWNRRLFFVWLICAFGFVPLVIFVPFGVGLSYAAAAGVMLVGGLFTLRMTYLASEECTRAGQLLQNGDVDAAVEILERLCVEEQDHPFHGVFVYQRALAYTQQGRHRRALSLFNAIRQSKVFERRSLRQFAGHAHAMTAYSLALVGELRATEQYLDAAESRLSPEHRGVLVFPRAVLLARTGDAAGARAYLETHHRDVLSGTATRRATRLLWSWVAEQDPTSEPDEAQRLRDGLYPVEPGEFDWICPDWPELAEYVRTI